MFHLTSRDISKVMARVPDQVQNAMKRHNLILGGGFIRAVVSGDEPSDIDLFAPTSTSAGIAARELAHDLHVDIHQTGNALTITPHHAKPIQIITKFYFADPTVLIRHFDFTVCQAAIFWVGHPDILTLEDMTRGGWDSVTGEAFYSDLASKELVYTEPSIDVAEPGGSLYRTLKFIKREYYCPPETLAQITTALVRQFQLRFGPIEDDNILRFEQFIIESIRAVDPEEAVR